MKFFLKELLYHFTNDSASIEKVHQPRIHYRHILKICKIDSRITVCGFLDIIFFSKEMRFFVLISFNLKFDSKQEKGARAGKIPATDETCIYYIDESNACQLHSI